MGEQFIKWITKELWAALDLSTCGQPSHCIDRQYEYPDAHKHDVELKVNAV
jgi:hypothetical protein